jgi:PAS domain S-box-containing protein
LAKIKTMSQVNGKGEPQGLFRTGWDPGDFPELSGRLHGVRLTPVFFEQTGPTAVQIHLRTAAGLPAQIARARQFIQAHFQENLSLATVARHAGMSRFHFCKMFKRATGVNFNHYVSRVRVEMAKHRLVNPHYRVSEIAFEVGFESLSHFNRVFKNLAGVAPTEFRRHLESHEIHAMNENGCSADSGDPEALRPRSSPTPMTGVAEYQREESPQARLAAIVDSSEDAIIGETLDGLVTSWNPGAARMLGCPAKEAIGGRMLIFTPSELAGEEPANLARIARGESVDRFETIRLRKDGERRVVSVTMSALKDRAGRVVGALQIARDLTERKAAEAEVVRLNAELERRVAQRAVKFAGAGPGRAIVRRLARPHGGRVWVKAKVDQGAF